MTPVGDHVGTGIVASLPRPGANITGLSLLDTDLDSKRIELLKEAVPGLMRIAILWSANDPGMALAFSRVEVAAQALGLSLQSLAVREPDDFPAAFQAAAGPIFSHHPRMDPDTFDFEIDVPVTVGGLRRRPREGEPITRRDGGADGLPRALRGPRLCLGRARCLDRRRGTRASPGPLGVLRRGPAHGAQPATHRTVRVRDPGPRRSRARGRGT